MYLRLFQLCEIITFEIIKPTLTSSQTSTTKKKEEFLPKCIKEVALILNVATNTK